MTDASKGQTTSDFTLVNSDLYFGWWCSECDTLNHVSWTNFSVYQALEECKKCEKAHRVRVPWDKIVEQTDKETK